MIFSLDLTFTMSLLWIAFGYLDEPEYVPNAGVNLRNFVIDEQYFTLAVAITSHRCTH